MLLLTLAVQVRHSLGNMLEISDGKEGGRHRRRRASSPLGVVGSLAHYTIGLATEQSYQELQVLCCFPPKSSFQGDEIGRQVWRRVSCI